MYLTHIAYLGGTTQNGKRDFGKSKPRRKSFNSDRKPRKDNAKGFNNKGLTKAIRKKIEGQEKTFDRKPRRDFDRKPREDFDKKPAREFDSKPRRFSSKPRKEKRKK